MTEISMNILEIKIGDLSMRKAEQSYVKVYASKTAEMPFCL